MMIMKRMKSILAAAMLMLSMGASAQATYTATDGTQYVFKKHWFLDLEAGGQYTLGETKFRRLLSPNVQGAIGYQFNPVLGLRLQANGWQSKGGWNGYVPQNGMTAFTKSYKYNYVAPGLDLMVDLSSLIAGYNPFRAVNLQAFVGAGANIASHNCDVIEIANNLQDKDAYLLQNLWDGTKVRPFGRAGLQLGIRLSDYVSVILEGNANALSDKYNSKKDNDNNFDWYFNALAGLRINLGKSYTKILPPPPAPEPEPVVEPEPEPAPAPAPVVEKVEPIRRDVFFQINKFVIRDTEAQKVKDIADYMQKYPESKVVVTGYADAGTGNDKINDRLAAQRADAVVKALKEQYGISESRISYDSKGARIQPFAENDMNRVSICIAE
jgi:outer membrane protein OmpA-like peptidoglycan-associated protein